MKGATHEAITRAVFGPPYSTEAFADEIAKWASRPDGMLDVSVGSFGTKIAGLDCSALTHFQVQSGMSRVGGSERVSWRGYAWRRDRSLSCLRKWDPRTGDVGCHPSRWADVVGGPQRLQQHPLRLLIDSLEGRATLDADNFTFPTAASMVDWIWHPWQSSSFVVPPPPPSVIGAVCHFLQDVVVPHHARGYLKKRHSCFEAAMHAVWIGFGNVERLGFLRAHMFPQRAKPAPPITMPPRTMIEMAAEDASEVFASDSPFAALGRGIYWTSAFMRCCVMPALEHGK